MITKAEELYLHFTMLLLKPEDLFIQTKHYKHLHFTMLLLKPVLLYCCYINILR